MNRLAAIIENGLQLLETEGAHWRVGRIDPDRVTKCCLKRGIRCQSRMREIVEGMAGAARQLVQLSKPDTQEWARATKQAAFYASLLERSNLFAGTAFERFLLNAAIDKLQKPSASPAAEQAEPEGTSPP